MGLQVKRYAYRSAAGVHWPDAVIDTEEYYAVDFTDLIETESETVDSVLWEVPDEITVMDSYINSEYNEAHVKLNPVQAGIFKITCILNTTDTGRTQSVRKEVILKVR